MKSYGDEHLQRASRRLHVGVHAHKGDVEGLGLGLGLGLPCACLVGLHVGVDAGQGGV